MAIEDSRSTLPDSSFSTMSSSSANAVSKLIAVIAVFSFAIVVILIVRRPRQEIAGAADQGLDMHGNRRGERPEVIAAFEHGYNAPFGMLVGNFHEVER